MNIVELEARDGSSDVISKEREEQPERVAVRPDRVLARTANAT
jgi:hypothetical protein